VVIVCFDDIGEIKITNFFS